jgi:hypothetical protein
MFAVGIPEIFVALVLVALALWLVVRRTQG